ncbi:MAG: 3-hydroxyacyl-CoA dehydrogenase family protein [Planctomycetota bacterium]
MIRRVAVLGAGTMGQGIAQVVAMAGLHSVLYDVDGSALERAARQIESMVAKGVERGKLPPSTTALVAERLAYESALERAIDGADCVIEAVFEDAAVKSQLFARVAEHVDDDCLLASNTSSLSITGIASGVPSPGRVAGMHFFNPVPIMPLVEVVRGLETSQVTIDRAVALARELGKEPIVVRDSPGFATSRLGVVIGLEAIRMLESGVGAAEDIDKAMELGYRHPMGPLRLSDLVGLDVRLAIAEHLHREIGEQFRPPALLRNMVRAGRLGKKSGQGFYTWQ